MTARAADRVGQVFATWQDVVDCDYRAWDRERIVIDTARLTVEQCVPAILAHALDGNQRAPAISHAELT